MRLKLGRTAVSCALVAAMATMALPVHAFAETDAGDYLGEVAVAYGDDGADQLEAAGYEVVEGDQGGAADVNAGNGTATYIGYKSTDDPSQAITDLAVMNMKGGYNISAWKDELENLSNQATAKAYKFAPVLKELRINYLAWPDKYQGAIDLLNNYTEDDSGLGMGDFLLDEEKCTSDTLANVMLQSNPETFLAVEYLLSKGLADDWTERVSMTTTTSAWGCDEEDLNDFVDQVLNLRPHLVAYQKSQVKVDDISEDIEGAIEDADTQSEVNEVSDAMKYGSIYEALEGIKYLDGTLLDLFLTPKKELTIDMIGPVASKLSKGQLALMNVVGIDTLILDSVNLGTKTQNAVYSSTQKAASTALQDAGVKAVSMYEGVNREIFTNDNVALTSDAIRQQSMTGDTTVFFNNEISLSLYALSAMVGFCSVFAYVGRSLTVAQIEAGQMAYVGQNLAGGIRGYWQTAEYQNLAASSKAFGIACGVLAAVACIFAGVGIAIDIYNSKHPKRYTIPDVIVDKVDYTDEYGDEDSYYVDYEVARLTTDGSAADMNGGSGVWNCLYYTTSKKAGDPVTVDELVAQTSSTNSDTSLSAVHAFGETAALNLNGRDDASYLFFARDAEAFSGSDATGSAFGAGYLALAAGIALVVGLAGGFGIATATRRRKEGAAA